MYLMIIYVYIYIHIRIYDMYMYIYILCILYMFYTCTEIQKKQVRWINTQTDWQFPGEPDLPTLKKHVLGKYQ